MQATTTVYFYHSIHGQAMLFLRRPAKLKLGKATQYFFVGSYEIPI